jgi:putative ABC transport system permease protein
MAIGGVVSVLLARSLTGLLYGVTAADPVTYLSMPGVLALVAAIAGFLPARRASRIDPSIALRAS